MASGDVVYSATALVDTVHSRREYPSPGSSQGAHEVTVLAPYIWEVPPSSVAYSPVTVDLWRELSNWSPRVLFDPTKRYKITITEV